MISFDSSSYSGSASGTTVGVGSGVTELLEGYSSSTGVGSGSGYYGMRPSHRFGPSLIMAGLFRFVMTVAPGVGIGSPASTSPVLPYRPRIGAPISILPEFTWATKLVLIAARLCSAYSAGSSSSASMMKSTTTEPS